MFKLGKTTKADVENAKRAYRNAVTAHWAKDGPATLAEGDYIRELKARARVLIEAHKLGQ